ncbi:MAG: outer membrane beta-barrel protein [Lacibacter sp.]
MKLKLICLIGMSAVMGSVSAQKSSVLLKGGLNMANVSITKDGSIDDAKTLVSFHAGLQGDIQIVSLLYLQPGIFFTGKGSKTQIGNTTDATYHKATTNPMYIEVPVNVVVKVPVGEQSKFFIGAGPYVAMGVAGKNKQEGKFLGASYSSTKKIEFSNDDPTTSAEEGTGFGIMRRFDYGLNGTIGFEGEKALFSVNYGLGLAKLQSGTNSSADENNKHRVLSFTVGFRL